MPMVQICETVTAASMAGLLAARDSAADADLVELRVDGVEDLDVASALAGRRRPAIVTCRPDWEGGRYTGGEQARAVLLEMAAAAGAEFVDVEWRASWRLRDRATPVVLSHHDFEGTPPDLPARVAAMRSEEPAVLKIAVTARALGDCVLLRDATRGGRRQVVIAMGAAGTLTRVCPWLFDSTWVYAGSVAPGQLSARELIDAFGIRRAAPPAAILGTVGPWAAARALAAAHNACLAAAGFDAVSVPLAPRDEADLQTTVRAFGIAHVVHVDAPLAEEAMRERARADLAPWIGGSRTSIL